MRLVPPSRTLNLRTSPAGLGSTRRRWRRVERFAHLNSPVALHPFLHYSHATYGRHTHIPPMDGSLPPCRNGAVVAISASTGAPNQLERGWDGIQHITCSDVRTSPTDAILDCPVAAHRVIGWIHASSPRLVGGWRARVGGSSQNRPSDAVREGCAKASSQQLRSEGTDDFLTCWAGVNTRAVSASDPHL